MSKTDTTAITLSNSTPVKLSASPENINLRCNWANNCRVYAFTASTANPPAPAVDAAIYLPPLAGASLGGDDLSFGEPFDAYVFAQPIDATKPFSGRVVYNKWD